MKTKTTLKVVLAGILITALGIKLTYASPTQKKFNERDYIVKKAVIENWPDARVTILTRSTMSVIHKGRVYSMGYRIQNGQVVYYAIGGTVWVGQQRTTARDKLVAETFELLWTHAVVTVVSDTVIKVHAGSKTFEVSYTVIGPDMFFSMPRSLIL